MSQVRRLAACAAGALVLTAGAAPFVMFWPGGEAPPAARILTASGAALILWGMAGAPLSENLRRLVQGVVNAVKVGVVDAVGRHHVNRVAHGPQKHVPLAKEPRQLRPDVG
jgi:hypothetical protein